MDFYGRWVAQSIHSGSRYYRQWGGCICPRSALCQQLLLPSSLHNLSALQDHRAEIYAYPSGEIADPRLHRIYSPPLLRSNFGPSSPTHSGPLSSEKVDHE